jgi:hypothetical protein
MTIFRRALIGVCFLLGFATFIGAWFGDVSRDDLTKIHGTVRLVENKLYSDERLVYFQVTGNSAKYKYSETYPGFDRFQESLRVGAPIRVLADRSSIEMNQPAAIYEAEVGDRTLVRFDETQPIQAQDKWYVMIFSGCCLLAAVWLWRQAKLADAPPSEVVTAEEEEIAEQIAERHGLLIAVVSVVVAIGMCCRKIPKFGKLAVAFFYFWIMPLYVVYLYAVARTRRLLVSAYCFSYWLLLVGLFVAAVVAPDFPGAEEYPELGAVGSRLTNVYILLNLAYGAALFMWVLIWEPDPTISSKDASQSTEHGPSSRAA